MQFLNTTIRIELELEGKKQKIKIPETYFLTERKIETFYDMPHTFFNSETNSFHMFILEKTDEPQNYGLKGINYTYNLDTKKLDKVTLFNRANWAGIPILRLWKMATLNYVVFRQLVGST